MSTLFATFFVCTSLQFILKKDLKHLTVYQRNSIESYEDWKREVRRIEADLIEEKSPELTKGCKAAVKKEENSDLEDLKKILMQLNDSIPWRKIDIRKNNLLDLHITGLPGIVHREKEENMFQEEEENFFQEEEKDEEITGQGGL